MLQILVVDDDARMRSLVKEALEREQCAVTMSPSAEEGLEALRSATFDLILMDVRLPGMSGLNAVHEIQKVDPRTPIVIMTADGTRDTALEAVRRGAYDYVTKPFSLDEMEITVRRALERKRILAELDELRQQVAALRSGPPHVRPAEPSSGTAGRDALQNLTLDEKVSQLERAFVMDALARSGGVQAAAARLLGVTERSVWHLVKKHRIEVSRLKGSGLRAQASVLPEGPSPEP